MATKIINTSGKRKSAIARATLKPGKGKVRINNTFLDNYNNTILKLKIQEPIILAGDILKEIDINVKVTGGGINGQAEAARLAIGRALAQYDKKLEKEFENYDRRLIVADVRRKETRKPGRHSKARAKSQKSYR
ncbi:MAG: 30S ribosomal protein S9 [Nanoarchaeota archaeon]|nr:30S ribosomal protein S9 [Nanoarchaeota archaeon]